VLGEERGAELEGGLVLARVNGVPDRPHPPLRDTTGEPELTGHPRRDLGLGFWGGRRAPLWGRRKKGEAVADEKGFISRGL
jgi:hypothetical protein